MLVSPRKKGLDSLFKEVRVFKEGGGGTASSRLRTCVRRKAVFGSRFQVFWCIFYIQKSGKKKAHKHKSFWPVTPPVTGVLPTGRPGVKVLCTILGTQGT